jgi:plastocyanin
LPEELLRWSFWRMVDTFRSKEEAISVQTRADSSRARAHPDAQRSRSADLWGSLLVWSAAINASLFAAIGIRHVDREAIAFAVLYVVGLFLLRFRRGLLGVLLLGGLSLNTEFWMLTATVSNFQNSESLIAIVQPLALAIVSAVVIVAAIGSLVQRGKRDVEGVRVVAVTAVAVFALAFAGELVLNTSAAQLRGSEIGVNIQNAAYSSKHLTANSGEVSLSVTNQDLFWHTFTIDKLAVNVTLPVNSHRSVSFKAPSGTYTFYCAIPGHRQAGMQGTITVP